MGTFDPSSKGTGSSPAVATESRDKVAHCVSLKQNVDSVYNYARHRPCCYPWIKGVVAGSSVAINRVWGVSSIG